MTAASSDEPGRALAMVLLERAVELTPDLVLDAWNASWPDLAAPSAIEQRREENGHDTITFELDDMACVCALMPVPIPNDDAQRAVPSAWLWRSAEADLQRVEAHIIVWVTGPGRPLDAHIAMTRVVAALIRSTPALGVYRGDALLIKADVFDGLAHEEHNQSVIVFLWVAFLGTVESGYSSLFTVGMGEFGLMEIEVRRSRKELGDLRELAIDVASWLIREGKNVGDGETVGRSATERVKVRYTTSMLDRAGPVYTLVV